MKDQFDPLTGDILPRTTAPQTPALSPDTSPTEREIALLATLPDGELKDICKRVLNARWGEVAMMTRQERLEAGNLRLWHKGLTGDDVNKWLPALREGFDREVGKSVTPIAQKIDTNVIHRMVFQAGLDPD